MAEAELRAVGALDDFPLDRFRVLELDGRQVGVVRTSAGVFAVRNSCPHQRAAICSGSVGGAWLPGGTPRERTYGLEGEVVRCPWHGLEFHLGTGEPLFGTTTRRLVTYATEVRDGQVYVRVRSRARVPTPAT